MIKSDTDVDFEEDWDGSVGGDGVGDDDDYNDLRHKPPSPPH